MENLDRLKQQLSEVLFINLDDYGLEEDGKEILCNFLGMQIRSAFQPIRTVGEGDPLGFEALLRPSIGDQYPMNPQTAFVIAESMGRLIHLDRICRSLHMLNYLKMPSDKGLLFLNVHPRFLTNVNQHGRVFEAILHAHSIPTHEVVIEVLENAVAQDKQFMEAIVNYRDRGYRIAIDDFGRGHSNLERLWQLSPEFVKLDMSIIQGAAHNSKVRKILPKLVDFIQALDAEVIVEGVETRQQQDLAVQAGAKYIQGYFLGKPAPVGMWQ